MLRIMAGVDPKDRIAFFGICLCKARFTGHSSPRAVSLSLLLSVPDARHPGRHGPEGHLCSEVVAALVDDYGSGMFLLVLLADAVRAVFTSLSAGPPAGGEFRGMAGFAGDDAFCVMSPSFVLRPRCLHLDRYGPEGRLHGASLSWCRGLFPLSSLPKTIEILL